jgi:hypothetical protein
LAMYAIWLCIIDYSVSHDQSLEELFSSALR